MTNSIFHTLCKHPVTAALLTSAVLLCFTSTLTAQQGDTTSVRLFDEYLWTWNGHQDRWAEFPDEEKRYEKIRMRFKLTCPVPRCGEWDYTMHVYLRHHTGQIDSTLKDAPSFTVNNRTEETLLYSNDTTWSSSYNDQTMMTDVTANDQLKVLLFENTGDPWTATDSLFVWRAGYYNYIYDGSGNIVDSSYVQEDATLKLTTTPDYVPFEVIDNYELGRFITPYGSWFRAGWEYTWEYDVTDYAFLLRDSVEIRTVYSGWSQGSLYTLDFDLIEGIPARDVFRIDNIYQGSFTYGNPNDPIEEKLVPKTVTIEENADMVSLRLVTSGHGFGGTDNAAEFSNNTHTVAIDGETRFSQHLWRHDCGQNPVYPQAGTWYYPRGGWCPGDVVYPFDYDMTPYITPGEEVTIDYNMEEYVNQDPSKRASYTIQAQVMQATGPNFTNEAVIEEIQIPNDAMQYQRMNPVCGMTTPVIVVKNRGGADLTSLTIRYGIDGNMTEEYQWTGSIPFLRTEEVTLPGIPFTDGDHTFNVELSNPNGADDEYPSNNAMEVTFDTPLRLTANTYYLVLRTDEVPQISGNSNGIRYEVRDINDNILYQRGNFDDNTLYRDTFELPDGCYRFLIYDEFIGDGLLPIFEGSTPGYFVLSDGFRPVHDARANSTNQLANFGDREVISFTVGAISSVDDDRRKLAAFNIYPNPSADGTINIQLLPSIIDDHSSIQVEVFALDGRKVWWEDIPHITSPLINADLTGYPSGTYLVRVTKGDEIYTEKVIVQNR